VGLFQRGGDDSGTADAAELTASVDRLSGLPLPQRAAELMSAIAPALEQVDDYPGMRALVGSLLPDDADWMSWSPEQRTAWLSLELALQEAFQALVLARMLIRRESQYKGATDVTYALGPDGRAAQGRGDVAEVVARRLPD
jgi:hypothetical protein